MVISAALTVSISGLLFGFILVGISKKFHVNENPKISMINEFLPGANCGACGYTGCQSYAKAIVMENAEIDKCMPGGESTINAIGDIMGIKAEAGARKVARILCQGLKCGVKDKYQYTGAKDCTSAAMVLKGQKECSYGCLGFSDCIKVCPFDAMSMDHNSGLIIIDEAKCKACGKCVDVCPKNIIELIPSTIQSADKRKSRKFYYVACMSNDKGGQARKKCKLACIGCKKCQLECKFEAITIDNFLAKIDYDKCTNCAKCFKVCPTDSIISLHPKVTKEIKN